MEYIESWVGGGAAIASCLGLYAREVKVVWWSSLIGRCLPSQFLKLDLEKFEEKFYPLAVCGLRKFTVYQLPRDVSFKTTKSNICVDLEKFCLDFC